MILDRETIIRLILTITLIFAIVYFAPRYEGQNDNDDNDDMVMIDKYRNIDGFEYATDVVVLHDDKRNATCWVYNYKSMHCLSDKDLI